MNELIIKNIDKKYETMLQTINQNFNVIEKTTENFNKTQSQFMDNMLTVSHPTPIRNIRQILAEINKSYEALQEVYFKNKKEEVKIKKLERQLQNENDELEKELIQISIDEKNSILKTRFKYIQGAIRKISNYVNQYNNILKSIGVENIDEVDFEEEEEKYHIMKSFEQGLIAARSHNGIVDEGNQIYFSQIGINGTVAQVEVANYLNREAKLLSEKQELNIDFQLKFLNDMYEKFKGCSKKLAEYKGMSLNTGFALLGEKE